MTTRLTGASFLSEIEPHLRWVRVELQALWNEMPESIRQLLEQGALNGGKMLRPALLLLWGRAFGNVTRDHADEALGVLRHIPQTSAKAALMDMPGWIMQEVEEGTAVSDRGSSVPFFHSQS